ncbi:MAG: von Willebrand factor type A domain-containing protein [Oscillospiraceae bacterium]|nr:von Willebrand factor type A domain-containing protein [Oscillospiraceae bacterium]
MKNNILKCILISTLLISAFTSCGDEAKNSMANSSSQAEPSRSDDSKSENSHNDEFKLEMKNSDESDDDISYSPDYDDGASYSPDSNISYSPSANDSDISYSTSPDSSYDYYGYDEEYSEFVENTFKSVLANPLSTFSSDVDTASYSTVRRMINDYGFVYDANAVRIEEMINYFDYNYAPPTDDAFSVTTEMSECPWNTSNKLLSIGVKGKEIETDRIPSNIVFLLDVSGSMYSDDKLPLMVEAFCMLTENLNENDRVSIVTYAGGDAVLLTGTPGNEYAEISSVLHSLEASGSTNGAAGINTAYELAEKYFIKGGNNRVILATDGDLNVGVSSVEELEELITEKRESGVYLSVLGFGTGNIKDNRMETLADNGNGNYAYIDSISEARKTLVEEMGGTLFTIAKDVKFQVEFNPQYVSEYRLVGYENRLMNDQDFYDDTKDAGEIGSGHTVTALYEIVPVDSELPLKYQADETAPTSEFTDEWLTVSVSYKEPDSDKSSILKFPVGKDHITDFPSENMQFASCVAEFGMLLRESEYAGNITYDDILTTLEGLDCTSNDKYKKEFTELVKIVSEN